MRSIASTALAAALAAAALVAASEGCTAAPAITVGGVSSRGMVMRNVYGAQQRNNAVLNRVQSNIQASQRARYRAQ